MEFVGKKIKRKRLSKKYTLEYVSSELKISKDILKNIESDNFLSNNYDVFLLGHIRSYSVFLGLNSMAIIEEFKIQNDYEKINIKQQIPKPIAYNKFNRSGFLSFILIIFIFISFYYLFIEEQQPSIEYALVPDIPESMEPIIEKTIVEEQAKQNINNLESFPVEENIISSSSVIAAQNNENLDVIDKIITLKFINPTWIQIRDIDDNIILSKLMNKSDEYNYSLSSDYFITAGNAGNIIVLIDNKVFGKLGKFGEVVDTLRINSDFQN